jgi:isoleucyl-tRNA synthetase
MANEPKRALMILSNIGKYIFELGKSKEVTSLEIEDKWILSRLNNLVETATKEIESIRPDFYLKAIENFFVLDLSRTYIQIIRDRVQQDSKTRDSALSTLFKCYSTVLKLLAPTIPFLTEKIYQDFKEKFKLKEESIHLCEWPKSDLKLIGNNLEERFEVAKKVIEKSLALRTEKKVNLRWPLKSVSIESKSEIKDLTEVIKKQVNVKNVLFKKSKLDDIKIDLDFKQDKELEEEGYLREVIRAIQDARKKSNLKKEQEIKLSLKCDDFLKKIIEKNQDYVKSIVNTSLIDFNPGKKQLKSKTDIKNKQIEVYF